MGEPGPASRHVTVIQTKILQQWRRAIQDTIFGENDPWRTFSLSSVISKVVEKCGPINMLCVSLVLFFSTFSPLPPLPPDPSHYFSHLTVAPASSLGSQQPPLKNSDHFTTAPNLLASHLSKAKSSSKPAMSHVTWPLTTSSPSISITLHCHLLPPVPLTVSSLAALPFCLSFTCQAPALLSPFSLLRTLFMQVPTPSTTSSSSGLGSNTNFWWCLPWPLLKLKSHLPC